MQNKNEVMLILEGTYPFNGGGVSTWAHSLCSQVSNVDFSLYTINANFEVASNYVLSEQVKNVIQVPIWSPLEPQELVDYGKKYHKFVSRKEKDDCEAIQQEFIPLFKELLGHIYAPVQEPKAIDQTVFRLWKFFQNHDYKKTMKSWAVWRCFYETTTGIAQNDGHYDVSLYDLTVGMRWIYRFLLPISIPVPKVDVTHLTLSGFPVLPALVLKYKYGTPMVLTEHGVFIRERLIAINTSEYSFFLKNLLIRFSECITKLAYYKADKIVSVNKFNRGWELKYGADLKKIEVVYNGIDETVFVPKEKPAHLKDIPTVVAAARVFELKDIITMIRSCAVVQKVIPNVRYIVYGDAEAVPSYTTACRELITELHLENNFIFAGHHETPSELFCEGDVSILTSISEGFPYTVIESMSCGVPVVATDVGGVGEALDESCGYLCKPKDFEALGNRVIELLQNEELRKKMGENARRKVIQNFTITKFINAYEKIYDSLMQSPVDKTIYLHSNQEEMTMEAS
ncbi:GT4 family glycosyltransferase PelF [Flavobacterium stagni]|uniref:DUF3492 domain-containing protein n=1 Tax=Flavobacterium stagni TaxID=2506421 RepID=A0A4Q1K952_9FLAO|nr:GT4 family glycosyltransferase PelF [Flavobacterium stagni]RXR22963.1 DUF3492 domain-containing protein [Flavobacterium stagni]